MRWRDVDWRAGWLDWRRKRFWAWVSLSAYALLLGVVAPWLLRDVIVDTVHTQLGRNARLDDVDINPFVLSLRLEGFAMDDVDGGALIAFDDLYVNFQLSSLFRWAWTFAEVRLTNPSVRVVREESGALNLLALVPLAPEDAPETTQAGIVRLLIERVEMSKGRAEVIDRAARSPFTTQLGPIDVAVNDVSTLPDDAGQHAVTIVTESGGRVQWSGTLTVEPLHSEGQAAITGVPMAKLSAYLPEDIALSIAEGSCDVSFRYEVDGSREGIAANVEDLAFALNGVRVMATGAASDEAEPRELIAFGAFRIDGGKLGWPERTVAFEEVSLSAPVVTLWRNADRRFVWDLVAPVPAVPSTAEPAAIEQPNVGAPDPDEPDTGLQPPSADEQPQVASEPPWNVTVARVLVKEGALRFEDRGLAPETVIGLTGIDGKLEALSLENDAEFPFALDFDVDGGGTLRVGGLLTAFPVLRFSAQAELNGLALPLAQPYIAALTYLELESGTLGTTGTFASATEETLTFEGSFVVDDFSVVHEPTRTPILSWKKLALGGIAVQLDAAHAEVASIDVDEPYGRIFLQKDGTLNVEAVLKPDETTEGTTSDVLAAEATADAAEATEASGAAQPWSVKIGGVRLKKASTDFRDESMPIPFTIKIHDLSGELSTFDTASRAPARFGLEGGVGQYGVARIAGALQPLEIKRNTTIDAQFENIELPNASPYAIRFMGHRIASGKLDLDTHYRIEDGRLNANHDIVLRDFALGEKVDSPDALSLPFGLAISLLKGPDGNIDVELPIEGDVDDPQFRIGGVIVKALVNLLTKIVTSPFRLLAGLVGMGDSEDFDKVAFQPGRADLTPPEHEKVLKLAEALVQRPQLTLEVPGVVDREADARALREAQVNAEIEEASAGKDQTARRSVVEGLFKARMADVPLEALVARHTPPAPDGEKATFDELTYLNDLTQQLIDAAPLAADALDNLAAARSAVVRDSVIAGATIEATRVGIKPPQDVEANDDGEVEMTLGVGTQRDTEGSDPSVSTQPSSGDAR